MNNPLEGGYYLAIVQAVVREGKHGPYAVAISSQITGSVTFSLSPDVWQESSEPQEGLEVILGDVRKKRAGWRAFFARFVRPTGNQQQTARR